MQKLAGFLIILTLLVSCEENPVLPPAVVPPTEETPSTPGEITKTAIAVPAEYSDVCSAAYVLRAPGGRAITSRDLAGLAPGAGAIGPVTDDPLAPECKDPGSLFWFKYDDNSAYQFVGSGYAEYHDLKHRAKISAESHNVDFPDTPWGAIYVDPPMPEAHVWLNDPVLPPLTFAFVSDRDDGTIVSDPLMTGQYGSLRKWTADTVEAFRTYIPMYSGGMLDDWNRDHPTDKAHFVKGPEQ